MASPSPRTPRSSPEGAALRIVLALLILCAPAAASEIEMSRPEGHPRSRFPLAVYVAPMADSTQEAAVKRAVEDWNSVSRSVLEISAFRWTARADEAAVRIALVPRASPKLMGETEIGADDNGVIELPVRITLLEPTARGQTPRETFLSEVAPHELGQAPGRRTPRSRGPSCAASGAASTSRIPPCGRLI